MHLAKESKIAIYLLEYDVLSLRDACVLCHKRQMYSFLEVPSKELCINLVHVHEHIAIYCGLAMPEPSCLGRAFGPHFDDFGSLLGCLLETMLGAFGALFWHRVSAGVQGPQKSNVELKWVRIHTVFVVQ